MGKKKEHQWSFMGNDTKGRGDLLFCDLCERWCWNGDLKNIFRLKPEEYQKMIEEKEIYGI